MKTIIFILLTTSLVFATLYEISYDCGSGSGAFDLAYTFGTASHTSSRVHFQVPSPAYGALFTQAKVLWHNATYGADVNFHFTIREDDTGLVLQSGTFIAPNLHTWQTYNLGSLGYVGSAHQFYLELIPESVTENCIMGCGHNPIDWRSQRRDDIYFPNWTDIDHDWFVHAIFDDSFISVQPTSLGNLKALYH